MTIKNIWEYLGLTQDRIGRRRFLIAFFSAQWGLPLAVVLLMGLFSLVFGEDSPILFLPAIVLFASLIFGFVIYIKICIRRVRDIGIAQGWWVLAIIPLINIPFVIFLCFKKGGNGSGHFSFRNNSFTEQFKRFFSHELSKPFMIICFGVIVAGSIYAGSIVSDLKKDIDMRIEQRKEELDTQYDIKEQKRNAETKAQYKKCLEHKKSGSGYLRECDDWLKFSRLKRAVERIENGYEPIRPYGADAQYRELNNIKQTPFLQLFFEKFGFGWWGVIALVAVFFLNILIVLVKFVAKHAPILIRTGTTQTKSVKTNIINMPVFQRYILFIALAILIILVLIFIKL